MAEEVKPKEMAPLIQYTQIEGFKEQTKLIQEMRDQIVEKGVAMGFPRDPKFAGEVVTAIFDKLISKETAWGSPGKPGSPASPEWAKQQLDTWGAVALGVYTAGAAACIAAEVIGLGQIEVPIWAFQDAYNTTGGRELIKEYVLGGWLNGILPAVKYYWQNAYRPIIPDPDQLVQARIRGELSNDDYLQKMAYHGFENSEAELMRLIGLAAPSIPELMAMKYRGLIDVAGVNKGLQRLRVNPDYYSNLHAISDRIPREDDLTEMFWRGRISDADFASALIKLGWRDPYLAGFRELARNVPGPQDLIRFYVREAYMPEMQAELPADFTGDMKLQGYEERWTKLFWGAHWVLVPVTQLYEMYHRRIIDYKTLTDQLKFHDFTSPWRDRLVRVAYRVWRLLDLRYGWELGLLTDAGMIDKLLDYGYSPTEAPSIAKVHMARVLGSHQAAYARVVAQAYRKGILDRSAAIAEMRKVNTIDPIIGLMLNAEELKRRIGATEPDEESRILTASQVLQAYRVGVWSRAESRTRLTDLGYAPEDADILLAINTPKQAAAEPSTKMVTQAGTLYKEGLMDLDEFQGWLRKGGLSEAEISTETDVQNLRYRYDFAVDIINAQVDAYRKDLVTEDELYDACLEVGMMPERASVLVARERYRKLPRPKAAS